MTVKIRQLNHSACRRTPILTQDVTYRIYLSSFPSPIWNNHKQHLCNSFQQSRLMSMSETLLFTSVHDLHNLENYNCRLEWSFNDFVSSTHAHFLVFFCWFFFSFFIPLLSTSSFTWKKIFFQEIHSYFQDLIESLYLLGKNVC